MKKVDVYEILIKTFGMLFLFTGVFHLEDLITTLSMLFQFEDYSHEINGSYFPAIKITAIIIGIYLIINTSLFYLFFFKTGKILKLITKEDDYTIILTPFVDQKATYKLILIILGFVLIANAIPNCISLLNEKVIAAQSDFPFNPYRQTYLIIYVIKTFIGCTLVIGADVISLLLTRKSNKENTPKT